MQNEEVIESQDINSWILLRQGFYNKNIIRSFKKLNNLKSCISSKTQRGV